MAEPKVRPMRILSLDGGGIRGAYQAMLLARLAAEAPALIPSVRLFAGTSIGGVNSALLASGISAQELVAFFRAHGKGVFAHTALDDIKDLDKVIAAGYRQDYLKSVLTETLGQKRLADLDKHIIIPAFQLDNHATPCFWKMKFFHNFDCPDSDGAENLVDVCLRSSAAPTYFPSYQGYIDGGVGCNNPSNAAISASINPAVGNQDLADIRLLSLSCGQNPTCIHGDTLNWGYLQWVRPLVDVMIDANVGIAHYHCTQTLAPTTYFRLDPILPAAVNLADASRLDDLLSWAADVDISAAVTYIKESFLAD